MINDNFLYGTASLLAGSSYTIPSHLAFGSTTGVLTAMDVVTSGEFDRNALTSKTATNNRVKFIGSRSSTEVNNETINVISLHNASTLASSGNLQLNMLIPALVHSTSFDIETEFWVDFNRG